eukprot:5955259-Pyramimonas_sp.AAC.1
MSIFVKLEGAARMSLWRPWISLDRNAGDGGKSWPTYERQVMAAERYIFMHCWMGALESLRI